MTMLAAALPARLRLAAPPADDVDADRAPIVVEGLAVPWNRTVRLNWWGDTVEFAPGSLPVDDPARVKFAGDHRTTYAPLVFGYGLGFEDRPEGLWARFAIPREEVDDPDVARIVRQMGNGVRDALSIGVDIVEADESPHPTDRLAVHYRVTRGQLLETSSVVLPRFDDARHVPVAASADRDPDGRPRFRLRPLEAAATPADPDPVDAPVDDDPVADDPAATEDPTMPDLPVDDRVAAHAATVRATGPTVVSAAAGPLARFRSLGEYALARFTDPTIPDLAAAWQDQITTDNPGVIPPAWLTQVFGIVDLGRPFITALGGARSAGDSGMTIHWPYFDGDLYALIAEQATQKTDVTSVKVSIKDGNAGLKTYSGGSDVALQLIERSDPAYLTTYLRIMTAAFAAVTDRAAITAAAGAAGAGSVDVDLATADAKTIAAAVFEASVAVQLATGLPASVVAVSTDLFPTVAAAIMSVTNPTGNTAQGAADASTLRVTLAGLNVTHVPGAADGTCLVTNGDAFGWVEDGPRTIDALEVPKLGRDVAVYGYGAAATFAAKGIVKLAAAAP